MRLFSLALGNIWRWEKSSNRQDLIKYIRVLNLPGIELTLPSKNDLFSFKISKSNEKWLKKLKYVTIHAPFDLIKNSKNINDVKLQLDAIQKLYTRINAKNVIIHPTELPPPELLGKYTFHVSTENMSRKYRFSISELKKVMEKYPRIGLCLDVAHAYRWSKKESEAIISNFNNRITQIHFSGTYKHKDHLSIRHVTRNFIISIKPLYKTHVPIVIEEDIYEKNIELLKDEVNLIKNLFSKQT